MSRKERAIQFRKKIEANLLATQRLVRIDELTAEELTEMINIYPEIEMGVEYKPFTETGKIYRWNGGLYKIVQKHTTQPHYNLDELPALYTKVQPKEVVPNWKQPTGSHDVYNAGDKMIYTDGKVYLCKKDNTSHSPEAYPAAWKLVE